MTQLNRLQRLAALSAFREWVVLLCVITIRAVLTVFNERYTSKTLHFSDFEP